MNDAINMNIAFISGKGGAGKTFVSTNIARAFYEIYGKTQDVNYLDCDVEEPNGHLFLKIDNKKQTPVYINSPIYIDNDKCIHCGKCSEACQYHAIATIKSKTLLFQHLCHVCGACQLVCENMAIISGERHIGHIISGEFKGINIQYAELKTDEDHMSTQLIKQNVGKKKNGITVIDAPPGTSCSLMETIRHADMCIIVAEPTPFGIHDMQLAVKSCRKMGKFSVVIVNRSGMNDEKLEKVCENMKIKIVGRIPDDRKIAEVYSEGKLVFDHIPKYRNIFMRLNRLLIDIGKNINVSNYFLKNEKKEVTQSIFTDKPLNNKKNDNQEIVIISGKGGTGKTSIAASFIALLKKVLIADCDVDASNLHLIIKTNIIDKHFFSGSNKYEIDEKKCTDCGKCYQECRHRAIDMVNGKYRINEGLCEGCGTCSLACPVDGIMKCSSINGELYLSETKWGKMSHAQLYPGEDNSGKLVTSVKNTIRGAVRKKEENITIIDGSPGTGCPVTASINDADLAIIVTEPTVSGVHDLLRIIEVINHFNLNSMIIVNKSDINLNKVNEIKHIARNNRIYYAGEIPYDPLFKASQINGLSIIEYSDNKTTYIIKTIWKRILSELGKDT